MAQITDYTSLTSETKLWLANTNTADETVEGWIQLAESRFRRILSTLNDEVTITSVPASEFDDLPIGFNGLREAVIEGTPPKPLVLVPPAQLSAQGVLNGFPFYIAIISGQFKFNPSAEGETVTYTYSRKLDPLSDGSPTNYLILEYPDVYLSAVLTVAQKFLRDDADAAQHAGIVDGWVEEMRSQDRRIKWNSQQKRMAVNPVVGNLR